MGQITRQQLCAELGISESTVRRLEEAGLPYTPIGKRTKRYDLEECKAWFRNVYRPGDPTQDRRVPEMSSAAKAFLESARKMRRLVEPS